MEPQVERLVKAVNSLLSDIEAMRDPDSGDHYFGMFSEFEYSDMGASVEWPNLTISAEKVRKAIADFGGR